MGTFQWVAAEKIRKILDPFSSPFLFAAGRSGFGPAARQG
jgi:hypothetical protein